MLVEATFNLAFRSQESYSHEGRVTKSPSQSTYVCGTSSRLQKWISAVSDNLPASFDQSDDLGEVERRLKLLGIEYVCRTVVEDGIEVQQLFFHDPDGFMIEVCNCENIPVVPLAPRCGRPLSRRLSNSQKRAMAINCELIDSTIDRPSPRLLEAACRDSPRLSSQNALPGFELGLGAGVLQGVRV